MSSAGETRSNGRWRALRSLGLISFGALVVVFGLVGGAAAAPCDPPADLEYVAMGDSYSSGFGLPDARGECNRSREYSYPKRIQQSEEFGTFVDVSCSGATTGDFYTAQNASNPPQLDALSATTDVVTFTIGGNDLGFTSILTTCATDGDCRGDYGGPGMPDLMTKISGPVGDKVEQAMVDSATRAPNADVFVLGYPDLLPSTPTGSAGWTGSCLPTSLVISRAERDDLRVVQAALNTEIELRANAAGARVHYVDIYTPSIGHDLCSGGQAWVSLLNVYHPTVLGMMEMGALATEAIRAELVEQCEAATTTTTTTTTSTTTTTTPTTTTTTPTTTTPTTTTAAPSTTRPPSTTSPTSAAPEATEPPATDPPATQVTPPPSLVSPRVTTPPSLLVLPAPPQPTVAAAVQPAPTPAPTPASTPVPTPAPAPAPSPAPAPGAAGQPQVGAPGGAGQASLGQPGQATSGQAGQPGLASTGSEPRGYLVLGAVLLGAGAGLVALNRRRRS